MMRENKELPYQMLDCILSNGISTRYDIRKSVPISDASLERKMRDLLGHQLIRGHLTRKTGSQTGTTRTRHTYTITRKGVLHLFSHELGKRE